MMYTTASQSIETDDSPYHGLRMSADEYFALGETFERYELIDGVVCMSPSPTTLHQLLIAHIARHIGNHLDSNPTGSVLFELDVQFRRDPAGRDVVYRPDIIYLSSEKLAGNPERITVTPDLVVEIISRASRRQDTQTKKSDYERFGVTEYWIVDPKNAAIMFFRLKDGRYVEVHPAADAFESLAIPGFKLDLAPIRRLMSPMDKT